MSLQIARVKVHVDYHDDEKTMIVIAKIHLQAESIVFDQSLHSETMRLSRSWHMLVRLSRY